MPRSVKIVELEVSRFTFAPLAAVVKLAFTASARISSVPP